MNNTYYQRPTEQRSNVQAPRHMNDNVQVVSRKSSTKDLIANIILAVLSVFLVIAVITLVTQVSDMNRNYEKSANSFWWAYESGRYADSIRDKYENECNGVKETAELTQCYAVADYFEAASLYKVAMVTGKADDAQKYLEVMAKAYSEMGDVSYLAEDIDAKLGIAEVMN